MNNLDKDTENKLKAKALYYTKKGRPGWNYPHLLTAVYYMKELLKSEPGNPKILIPAIYLHDIGYAGMLAKGYSYKEVSEVKKRHMIIGAQMSEEILKEMGSFTNAEIKVISHLVGIHDNLTEIIDDQAQLVFEADSLGQIDLDKVKPSFDNESYRKFFQNFVEERVPLFKTKTGKKYLTILLSKVRIYVENF
ncbi:HD domain-containing protein [Patescibacteria group bacterium]